MTVEVGVSEYGAPGPDAVYGVMQVMADAPGRQVLELQRRFYLRFGYFFTINEGQRSRSRQKALRTAYLHYVQYGSPWAALAAALYYSTHDPSRAGAFDAGGPGGRALSVTEHAWIVANGAVLGIIWTGADFSTPEWWHFDVDMSRAKEIAPATLTLAYLLTLAFLPTDPKPQEPEMAQADIDNAKVAAAIALSQATDGVWIKNVKAEAQYVVAARLGRKVTLTGTQGRAALRIYALGGDKNKFDAWLQTTTDFRNIKSGKTNKKD